MTRSTLPHSESRPWPAFAAWPREYLAPWALFLGSAIYLFKGPAASLAKQWWDSPDAGHGLLLLPLSIWLAWRSGPTAEAAPNRRWGIAFLVTAILSRAVGGLAAELFTQRSAIWLSMVGIILYFRGWSQVRRWWLPLSLLFLSIPLPELVLNKLSNPLQLVASKWGTALVRWRHLPVDTKGNVMSIISPETGDVIRLFVAEACSGLRSLTALLALGLAVGGMYLRTPGSRILLLFLAVPVAVTLNSIRVFLTAYLMYYVNPAFGQGFMHESQGWGLFTIAFLLLGGCASIIGAAERRFMKPEMVSKDA